ncbi:MAG: response regulator [bacterium]|nr:response regulator [bacterium]
MSFQDEFINNRNEELIEYMRASRLFSHIPGDLLNQLVPLADLRTYEPGDEILVEGQENDRVFFLIRGGVEIYSGGEFILELKRQGDLFGEMSVISSKPASATVLAKTRVQVFTVKGRNIGKYTDIDVERINHILYRLFAAVLTDKLALTTYKAKQYEIVNIYLNKTQQALAEKHKQLQKEKKIAESAANAKAAFIATMSHEIRTPLNGILGMAELLLSSEVNSEQREFTDSILMSGRNLLGIINDILDYSQLEEEDLRVEIEELNPREVIEDCLAIHAAAAANRGLELFSRLPGDLPLAIRGDAKRIAQVINNLLSNAIKFTDTGDVQLLAEMHIAQEGHEAGDELVFEVRDSGIGIPEPKQDELFQPFYQVDSSITRRHGGTGLGLVISKHLCELMDARIWFESEEGKGSRFFFAVPVEPVARVVEPEWTLPEGKHVVVFERSLEQGEALVERLSRWGMDVQLIRMREELMETLAGEQSFDLAILCLEGTESSGARLLEQIAALPSRAKLPLLLVTRMGQGSGMKVLTDHCRHLFKPIRERSLRRALNDLLGKYHLERPEVLGQLMGESYPMDILVVEDNRINQRLLAKLLIKAGYQPDVANNGLEALSRVAIKKYDLVFMDIQMPEMDGLTATQRIQAKMGVKAPFIIALTANVFDDDKQRYLKGGMDDYVGKPFSQEVIYGKLASVGALIAEKRAAQETE